MYKFFIIIFATILSFLQSAPVRLCYPHGPYPAGTLVPVYALYDNGTRKFNDMWAQYPYQGPLPQGLLLPCYKLNRTNHDVDIIFRRALTGELIPDLDRQFPAGTLVETIHDTIMASVSHYCPGQKKTIVQGIGVIDSWYDLNMTELTIELQIVIKPSEQELLDLLRPEQITGGDGVLRARR